MKIFIAGMVIPEVTEQTATIVRESLLAAARLLTDEEIVESLEDVPDGEGEVCTLVARVSE